MTCASVNSSELESVHFVLQTEEKFRSTKLALSLPLKMDSADGLSNTAFPCICVLAVWVLSPESREAVRCWGQEGVGILAVPSLLL